MHAQCLVAEFGSLSDAQVALDVLESANFNLDAVSLVTRSDNNTLQKLDEEQRGAEDTATASKSAGLGALIGGSVAVPFAVGTMIGPFIVAGPLVGMAVGATLGSLFGTANQWGIPENVAMDYEQRVKNGAVLVIVTDAAPRFSEAEGSLKTTGPISLQQFSISHHDDK